MLLRVGEQALAELEVIRRQGRQLRIELALGVELGVQGCVPRLEVGDDGGDLGAGEERTVLRSSARRQDPFEQEEGRDRRTFCTSTKLCSMASTIWPKLVKRLDVNSSCDVRR